MTDLRTAQPAGGRAAAAAAPKPRRILLANDRLGYGNERLHGAGRLMIEWTRALLARGHEVVPVILREPGALGRQVRDEGLPFVFLSRHPYDPRTVFDFVKLIRERDVQLLHLQAFGASTFGRLAARLTRRPAIVHIHADYRVEPKGFPWYVRLLDRILAPGSEKALAISSPIAETARVLHGFRADQVETLHNPVDVAGFRPPTAQERDAARRELGLTIEAQTAVCVARFDPVKGVDVAVEAWRHVAEACPEARLLLAGDGPMRAVLEEKVARYGLETKVRFLGYCQDVCRLLWAADLVIVPSRYEALGLAALEGMACGLPVVASSVGGLPEIVIEGENGYLVPPESPDRLGEGLVEVFAGRKSGRDELRDAAVMMAQEHAMEPFMQRLEAIYEEVLAKRGRR